ncbi:uncharacterized protein LOC141852066 isoform X2 [Brevipalpus obovatus]|uniref:uncharacterized protein LOC141852066 isoform X2 n=1 Tax=Brevipalpus obovatus TaxID=246614 RepID=UPI003D9EEA95
MKSLRRFWYSVSFYTRGTSSLQTVLISIGVHSLISVIILYMNLSWNHYSDYRERRGGIFLSTRLDQSNLIVNDIVNDSVISYRGWWFDHHKYDVDIQCFDQKWAKCVKVFSVDCRPNSIRAIYQFIPIKRQKTVTSVEFSVTASSTNLVQQSSDAILGLYAIVSLTNSETDIIRVSFTSSLDGWTRESFPYTSRPGTSVVEILVMLICTGSHGYVSFMDVSVIPIDKSNGILRRSDIVADCVDEAHEDQAILTPSQLVISSPAWPQSQAAPPSHLITLTTHVSMDRFSVLEKTLRMWLGPVSLSVYIPVQNVSEGMKDWQRMYLEKKLRNLNLSSGSDITFVLGPDDQNSYPINKLRNIAIEKVRTRFMLILDADFQPSPNLEENFSPLLDKMNTSLSAFVVPSFEFVDPLADHDQIPHRKEELLQLIFRDNPLVAPFRIHESVDAHKLTNYWRWFSSSKIYKIKQYSDKYEPYIIMEKTDETLKFDERFVGYGMNKVTHITELFASGYTFYVLPESWVLHHPHEVSSFNQEFLQDPLKRLKNRLQRFQFIKEIIARYDLNHTCRNNSLF